jgi:hypothetical protein
MERIEKRRNNDFKGWEKTRSTRASNCDFQFVAMEANTTYGATCVFLKLFKWWISLILDDGFSNVGRRVLLLLMLLTHIFNL